MTPGRLDLHLHTTASDGLLSPSQLVREAAARGVSLLALTDHDTTEGIAEGRAEASRLGLTLVPGVELSADSPDRDIHFLGYFLDPDDAALQASLRSLRVSRTLRNHEILARLAALGAPLSHDRLLQIAGPGSVGRPHIAAALVEAGHVTSQTEAFSRYLARGKPAFVLRRRLSPARACAIIKAAGGLAVLAHPAKLGSLALVSSLLEAGLDGLEAFHPDHSAKDIESFVSFARERSLLITGGTDSHGPYSERPVSVGSVAIPAWVGEEFLAAAPAWWRPAGTA